MIKNIKIVINQRKQYIPNLREAIIPGIFRGRPEISEAKVDEDLLVRLCPTGAIQKNPIRLDLGKCTFCGECAFVAPEKIKFTTDYRIASNCRENLIVWEGPSKPIEVEAIQVRSIISESFGGSLKLRQVSAGGDNSCELELNACGNVNFDMARFGIEFVASPRHADGIVITGPITQNMAEPLQLCYDAMPDPKIIILAGTDAISGGIFADCPALNRSFLDHHTVDLYIPGNPIHPLTFINGVLDLIKRKERLAR